MTCGEVRGLVHPYCDGWLDPSQVRSMERHLSECPACRGLVERARRMESLLVQALPVPDRSASTLDAERRRVLERLWKDSEGGRRKRRILNFMLPMAITAAATLLLALAWVVLHGKRTDSEVAARPPDPVTPPPPIQPVTPPEPFPRPVPPPPRPEGPSERVNVPPPVTPPVAPPAPPARTAVAEAPSHVDRMTDELLAAGLAETAGDRIRSFLHAADARLEELGRLVGKNEDLEEELATAYTLLLREGVAVVLDDREEPAEELTTARKIARDRAQQHISTLKDLNSAATGKAKAAVGQALEASLELARR